MSGKVPELPPDPHGSAPAEGRDGAPASLLELVAEASADAATEALKRHHPDPGSAGPYLTARALWIAMNMLLGPESARHFVVFLATQYLDDFDAGRKGIM